MQHLTNWAGNIAFSALRVVHPTSVAEIRSALAAGGQVRVLGSGHSFNAIADTTGTLLSLRDLPPVLEIDSDRRVVKVGGGQRYGDITGALHAAGWALPNTGSLPHIAVAGACATGTHGSGDRNPVLATSVSGVTIVTAGGDLMELTRDSPDFGGAVLALGALGVVVDLTLDLVPTFDISQYVYTGLATDVVISHLDEIMASAYSVSVFTTWRDNVVDTVWLKSAEPRRPDEDFFGGRPARTPLHPMSDVNPEFTTEQLGVAGPWHQRLPHFRLEFTPSNGDELQSEYFVDRRHGPAAAAVLAGLGEQLAPVLMISELRTVAADDLWISPSAGRDRIGLHFSWVQDAAAVAPVLDLIEQRLAPFEPVTHWGKVFRTAPDVLAGRHPRLAEFAGLLQRYDPAAVFTNDFVRRHVREPFGA